MFGRKKQYDDEAKETLADAVSEMLKLQIILFDEASITNENGTPKHKAIGYVFGFIDAALQSIGQDISDVSIGVPIVYSVINRIWPERAVMLVDFLLHNQNDPDVMLGMMHGGQQYLTYLKPKAKGAPMGLVRFMME